jgi:hypothetical protein
MPWQQTSLGKDRLIHTFNSIEKPLRRSIFQFPQPIFNTCLPCLPAGRQQAGRGREGIIYFRRGCLHEKPKVIHLEMGLVALSLLYSSKPPFSQNTSIQKF